MQRFCSLVAPWDHRPRHEGVNHTYFTYDRALGPLQLADREALIKSIIPAFLRVIVNPGGLITRILRMIMHLGGYSSQMGGLNHTYFTYDRALGRFHAAVGWVIGPTWVE